MYFSTVLSVLAIAAIGTSSQVPLKEYTMSSPFERLDKENAALLVVDHQVGLTSLVHDYEPTLFMSNILAHAALGKVFDLPTVLTTSAETGPNGPLPKEVLEMHPNAAYVRRHGEVNAWDNSEFREAVKATGKKQMILGGITTDVCVAFLALSLVEEGYTVFVNVDASGTFDDKTAADSKARMVQAGVKVVSNFVIATDLMRDWRNTPGSPEMLPYFDQYLKPYSIVARLHGASVESGQILPGEKGLLA